MDDLLQSKERVVKFTLELLNSLTTRTKQIKDNLGEILERQDYIVYSCKLCPGQPTFTI